MSHPSYPSTLNRALDHLALALLLAGSLVLWAGIWLAVGAAL